MRILNWSQELWVVRKRREPEPLPHCTLGLGTCLDVKKGRVKGEPDSPPGTWEGAVDAINDSGVIEE